MSCFHHQSFSTALDLLLLPLLDLCCRSHCRSRSSNSNSWPILTDSLSLSLSLSPALVRVVSLSSRSQLGSYVELTIIRPNLPVRWDLLLLIVSLSLFCLSNSSHSFARSLACSPVLPSLSSLHNTDDNNNNNKRLTTISEPLDSK